MNSGATAPVWATAASGGGKVLQVVTQQAVTELSASGSNELDISTLDITITPASTDSAIMVGIGSCPIQVPDQGGNVYFGWKLYRNIGGAGASVIYTNTQVNRAVSSTVSFVYDDFGGQSFIDSPNTTSECVYEFKLYMDTTGGETYSAGKGFTCTSYGMEFSEVTEV